MAEQKNAPPASSLEDSKNSCNPDQVQKDFNNLSFADGPDRRELLKDLSKQTTISESKLENAEMITYSCGNTTNMIGKSSNGSLSSSSSSSWDLPSGQAVEAVVVGDSKFQDNAKLEEQARVTSELTGISIDDARKALLKQK